MDFMDIIYYIVIPVSVVVLIVLIVFFAWYCKRRRNQTAINDALRSSQSYVNSTTQINHTHHADDQSITGQRFSTQSMNSDLENRNSSTYTKNNKKSSGNGGTPSDKDIVLRGSNGGSGPATPIKLDMIVPVTESPMPSMNDSDTSDEEVDKQVENNRMVQSVELNKHTSNDSLISNQHGTSSTPVVSSVAVGGGGGRKIVTLKKGSERLDSDKDMNESDPDIDDNDEINKIMNEDIDDDAMKRLTLHKKLSNINVRQRIGDMDELDIDDDEDDDDSLNDDLMDDTRQQNQNRNSNNNNNNNRNSNNSNNLLSPQTDNNENGNGGSIGNNSNNNNNNNNSNDSNDNKHRRMVSQEEIDYFDKMKDETTDNERAFRSRTVSNTAHTNMHTKLIDPQ